jgi:hypothetical protein
LNRIAPFGLQTLRKCIVLEKRRPEMPSPCSNLRRGTTASANEREIIMIGNKSFITLSLAAALGVLGVASATASDHGHGGRGGFVMPGSLDGVNPVQHPEIFDNPAVAASYGFVRSSDGTWHVRLDWRGGAIRSRAEYHQ